MCPLLWSSKCNKQIKTKKTPKCPSQMYQFYKLKKTLLCRLFSGSQHPYLLFWLLKHWKRCSLGAWNPCFMQLLKIDLSVWHNGDNICVCGCQHERSGRCKNRTNALTLWGPLFSWFKSRKESSNKLRVWKWKDAHILWDQGKSLLCWWFRLQMEKCDIHTIGGTLEDFNI